mgnify:CR=1 FL=1
MMTLIYRIILAGIVALIGWDLFTEEKLTLQLNAAMVLFVAVRHRANFARLRAGTEKSWLKSRQK